MASGSVETDARKLLTLLAGKEGAREGAAVSAGPKDATAAGLGAGPPGERLHRAVWRLIVEGSLEAALEADPPDGGGTEPGGAAYGVTRTGLGKARDG